MAHQILVSFRGEGAGRGELTWAQRGIWRSIVYQGASDFLGGVVPLPDGLNVSQLVDSLSFVMSRHQSLRTRLAFDADGDPQHVYQVVSESGEVPLEVFEAGDQDPAELAEEIRIRYESTDFDYANEWPLRMAAVCRDGVPTFSVAVYSHLAIDAHGLAVLITDVSTMDPAKPVTATQPLALAAQQARPPAQRMTDSALRHWERALRTASPRRFAGSTDHREPRYWSIRYHSPAADRAMRLIAARNGTDTSPVLLAAYAVALARTAGNNPVVLQLAVSNRFRPGFAESVSPLAQASPCLLDVADVTFDEAVGRAVQAAMSTYLNAYYDPVQRAALVARVNEERGAEIDLGCYFNDRRDAERGRDGEPVPTMAEILAAVADSEVSWGPHTTVRQPPLYLDVDDAPDGVEFSMRADTHELSPADMEAVLRTLEAVVVDAAGDATVATGVHGERASV
ncbi:MAG TPA: condensation domain-containing protein [Pseudonocardiaceae bacterium]|nr:condensation domain-containing protein [Pseudonocardiaceae bacterium]